jgi:hypothetical protein
MSIYGISRLLASRDLGPAQIVPTLLAFASEVDARCARLGPLFDSLEVTVARHGELEPAAALLRAEGMRIGGEVVATFQVEHRLGARDRLALEGDAPRIGGDLQALQRLVELLLAAADPQLTPLRVHDLVAGGWRPRPTFVDRRVEVMFVCASPVFEGDPRVIGAMFDAALSSLTVTLPFVTVRSSPLVIDIGEGTSTGPETIERATVPLRPVLAVEPAILAAVARQLGTALTLDQAGAHISVAA